MTIDPNQSDDLEELFREQVVQRLRYEKLFGVAWFGRRFKVFGYVLVSGIVIFAGISFYQIGELRRNSARNGDYQNCVLDESPSPDRDIRSD